MIQFEQDTYVDDVKAKANGFWPFLLERIGGIGVEFLDGDHHDCPKCGGKDRFRFADWDGLGGCICNQCFREKCGDGWEALKWATGKNFMELIGEVGDLLSVTNEVKMDIRYEKKEKKTEELEVVELEPVMAVNFCREKPGVTFEGLLEMDAKAVLGKFPQIVFPVYAGFEGERCGWVKRLANGKPYRHGKSLMSAGSKQGWMGQVKKVKNAEWVWKVEGETDASALIAATNASGQEGKHAVICNSGGAKTVLKEELCEELRGKKVVVVGDGDSAGQEGARRWLDRLSSCGAFCVPYLALEGGVDLRDLLARDMSTEGLRGAFSKLLAEVEASEVWKIEKPIRQREPDPLELAKMLDANQRGRGIKYEVAHEIVYRWVDGVWSPMPEAVFQREAMEFANEVLTQWASEGAKRRKPKIGLALAKELVGTYKVMRTPKIKIEPDSWLVRDGDEIVGFEKANCISMANGILDLDAMEKGGEVLKDHTPDWWSMTKLPYAYEPENRDMPHWQGFLDVNLGGHPERITILQEIFGYLLSRGNDLDKFFMFIGPGGNGKSVAAAVAQAMVAVENVSNVMLNGFHDKFALWTTRGKRLNISNESETFDPAAESILKNISSCNATLTYERKYHDAFEEPVTFKTLMISNNPPRFRDVSEGMYRRLIMLPFNKEIPEGERVGGMAEPKWWYDRKELSAILNWALEGFLRVREQGFTVTEVGRKAIEKYRTDCDSAREYLKEHFQGQPGGSQIIATEKIYAGYVDWCKRYGMKPKGVHGLIGTLKQLFKKATRKRLPPHDGKRPWGYSGIACRSEWDF